MVTLIMMMVVLGKWRERQGAEHSLSVWAHLTCSPVPASEWERKLVNSKTEDCSFLFSCCLFFSLLGTWGWHNVLWATLGPVWAPDNPSLYTSTGGGHESAFISHTKRLIYFSQGIKGHCKNALSSLSNIKRVRRHKRIPVVTESEDHYRTSRRRTQCKVNGAIRGNYD